MLALLLLGAGVESAVADPGPGGGVVCPPTKLNCEVTAEDPGEPADSKPGKPAGDGGEPGKPACAIDGKPVPCSTPELGTFNAADGCYWQIRKPQPAPTDPVWRLANSLPADWKPGDKGQIWDVSCPGIGRELMGGTTFSVTGPAGGSVDVQALAQQAVENLRLEGANIGIAPKPTGVGVVGMPVWIWNQPGPTRTGPATATATAGGVTVTATAKVRKVAYGMGDGNTVVLTAPGTPYTAEFGKRMSPDCGHRYALPSTAQTGGRYKVTATTTWTSNGPERARQARSPPPERLRPAWQSGKSRCSTDGTAAPDRSPTSAAPSDSAVPMGARLPITGPVGIRLRSGRAASQTVSTHDRNELTTASRLGQHMTDTDQARFGVGGSPNPLAWPAVLVVAGLVTFIAVLGGVVFFRGGDSSDPADSGPVPGVSARAPGGQHRGRFLPGARRREPAGAHQCAARVEWALYQTVALPTSKSAGPAVMEGDVARCYARTPYGALLAAGPRRSIFAPDWRTVTQRQTFGDARQKYVDARSAEEATSGSATAEAGDHGQMAGFKFVAFTDAVVVVEQVWRFPDGKLQASVTTVQWSDGDGKLQLQSSVAPSQRVRSLDGYIPWTGV